MIISNGETVSPLGVTDVPDENWRPIPGTRLLYSVSDAGLARSNGRLVRPRNGAKPYLVPPRILSTPPGSDGYPFFNARVGGKTISMRVHQCVALAFLGPVPEGQEVRHKNGVRSDCRLDNLEYGTRTRNIEDAKRHGTFPLGVDRPGAKITPQDVVAIYTSDESASVLALRHGISRGHVSIIRSGGAWSEVTAGLTRGRPRRGVGGNAKITPEQAVEIFAGADSDAEAAARHGLTRHAVRNIRSGKAWGEFTGGLVKPVRVRKGVSRKLSDADVLRILSEPGTLKAVAARNGVSRHTVYLIRKGRTRKNITRPQTVCPDPPPVDSPQLVVGCAADRGTVGTDDFHD